MSEAYIDAIEKLARMNLIDELEGVIQSLQEIYLDIYMRIETE